MLFDNFDRFVESKNGKDTLHDTVSVPYELVFPELSGSFDGKLMTKAYDRRQEMILKLTQEPQVVHQLNLKQELQ